MDTVFRWGIIGSGHIARRFAQSLAHEPRAQLVAVSGRSQEGLEAFAADIPQEVELVLGHEQLLARDDIDVVYIALPHGLHETWACKALMADKSVLCEKPAGLNAAQVGHMVYVAQQTGQLFVEGMKARFEPVHALIAEELKKHDLGAVTAVDVEHRVPITPDRGGYIVDAEQGGLLLDVGVYGASWIEEFLPGDITLDAVEVVFESGVDWRDEAKLHIGGVPARLYIEGSSSNTSLLTVTFERGRLEVDTIQRPLAARLSVDGANEPVVLDAPYAHDDFSGEIAHVTDLLEAGATESDVMPHAASLRVARILDVIRGGFPSAQK